MANYHSQTDTGKVTVSIHNNRYHTGNIYNGLHEYADAKGLYLLQRTDAGWVRINHIEEAMKIEKLTWQAKLKVIYVRLLGRAKWLLHKLSQIVTK